MRHVKFTTAIFAFGILSVFFFSGCENVNKVESASWNVPKPQQDPEPEPGGDPGSSYEPGTGVDEVDFGALNWAYGDFNGSKAVQSGVVISHLRFTPKILSFNWDANMAAWGFPGGSHAEYCAMFVQRRDGRWVGGKFDWIANNNKDRPIHHVYPPGQSIIYKNWGSLDWSQVDNPCNAAFVIVETNARRRSNVIVGKWTR